MEDYKQKLKRMTELSLLVEIRPESLGQMGWDFGEDAEIADLTDKKLLRG